MRYFYIFSLLSLAIACKKNDANIDSKPAQKNEIDRLNYLVYKTDTIYHFTTYQSTLTSKWIHGFNIYEMSWWNDSPNKQAYFALSTPSGSIAHINASFAVNDSVFIGGSNYTDVPIKMATVASKSVLQFNDIKIFPSEKDTSKFYYISGQCILN